MSTEMSCHFIYLLQVSKKCLKSGFIQSFFFHDLIHVYSPGAGTDLPRGQDFDVNRKALYQSLPICCKFQRNLFEV